MTGQMSRPAPSRALALLRAGALTAILALAASATTAHASETCWDLYSDPPRVDCGAEAVQTVKDEIERLDTSHLNVPDRVSWTGQARFAGSNTFGARVLEYNGLGATDEAGMSMDADINSPCGGQERVRVGIDADRAQVVPVGPGTLAVHGVYAEPYGASCSSVGSCVVEIDIVGVINAPVLRVPTLGPSYTSAGSGLSRFNVTYSADGNACNGSNGTAATSFAGDTSSSITLSSTYE